ncbi:VWA domain-containing protein [Paenibacillus soyae]|uniref:VWA domain-containing protein n=1 Tax=Paenibacillus soyae TaxID=2969249 RepID=A0A9X2MSD4_9BACL|nr:VWA domain-containing protein [Paenibacillus soyae]MCR2805500.1 VWA domain-containing protein [Paenibacillus soyae]
MQANSVWALLLLLPLIAYIWWMVRRTPRLSGVRKLAVVATRTLTLLLLIALAAGLTPYRMQEQRNVVFVADRSASMKGEERQGAWIAKAWTEKPEEGFAGIVSTGLHAVVDRPLASGALPSGEAYSFRTELASFYTDLAKGLQLGAAMLKEQGGGRIVLLSDGAENAGDAMRQARLLQDAGIPVDVVHLSSELARDASIEELRVPGVLKQGETFSFELAIRSTFAGEAELRLYEDDRELAVSKVMLERGDNRFAMQNVAIEPGFHRYRAEVAAAGDEQSANDAAHAFGRVGGPPKVLIVEGKPGSSVNIEAAMTASLIGHETIGPEQLSRELASYAAYDSIILHNVPATRIAEQPMEWLAKATGDYGVGLVMLGGDESFGLGGYFQTPVERALPVYMDLKGRKQMPSLGLVLVIDRSGSMGDGKLELAKEAAMRTVELLRDADTVGVVAFDSMPWWVVEPTPLTNRDEVLEKIQGIQAEGGTEIYSALDSGYQGLLQLDAQRKHMILLTDGQSSTNMNYRTITDAMNENGMTLSTVAVGDGADIALLERLANDGKGRYYFTRDQSTLPAIFSRETVLMSRTYIVDGTFTPGIGDAGAWGQLWERGVPPLQAYVATSPKEMAEVALWSADEDPILARWTYGAGRSVAWTSDATGKWAPDWVKWEQFPEVLTEWVKWTFPQFDSSPYRISTSLSGGEGTLIVEAAGGDSGLESGLAAVLQDSGGETFARRLMPVAPGRYEARLESLEPGAYLTQIGRLGGAGESAEISEGMTAGYVVPYSPEYRIGGQDGSELLRRIAEATGGRQLGPEDAARSFQFDPIKLRVPYDISRELLIAVLLLWLLDIALRRLSLPWGRIGDALLAPSRTGKRQSLRSQGAAQESAIGRMKQRTQERSRFYGAGGFSDAKPAKTGGEPLEAERNRAGAPSSEANRPSHSAGQIRRDDLADRANSQTPKRVQPQTNGNSPADAPEQSSSIHRLLAAKNKNKR